MSRKLTQEEFIAKAKETHGDRYDYSRVVYKGGKHKVTIGCMEHGFWLQAAESHTRGAGCPVCSKISVAKFHGYSTEEFIERAIKKHGSSYDYSEVNYISAHEKVNIQCNRCKRIFPQTPASHLRGRGCQICMRGSTEYFVDKANSKHKNLYDYSLSEYVNALTKVKIICKQHGVFEQFPHDHHRGSGCPSCKKTGYNIGKSGNIYILQSENILKLGISNRPVKERLAEINRSSGKDFKVLSFISFANGAIPKAVETILLKELKTQYEQPKEVYFGSTECFLDLSYDHLLLRVAQLSAKYLENKFN